MTVSVTVSCPVLVRLPSDTDSTTGPPEDAVHDAATLAVTVPFVFTIPVTVTPTGADCTVTVRLPAGVASSLTVAIVWFVAGLPRRAVTPPAGTIVGAPSTDRHEG